MKVKRLKQKQLKIDVIEIDHHLADHESISRRKLSNSLQNLEKVLGARMIFFNLKDSRESVDD